MESLTRKLLFSGSFGAGKSRVGCEKGYFLSIKYPGNKGLIIRKTFASLRITTMDTWFRHVCPKEHIKSYNQETHICELVNGSQILFLGIDDPERLGSLEVGWIFIDEAIELSEADYIMLQGRLRLSSVPFRQLFMATNPSSNQHYLYKEFFESGSLDCEVVEANSLENPYNPVDYTRSLQTLTGRYYQRYVLGKWVGFEGLVYDQVDVQQLLCQPFEVPEGWPRYRAIDFGYTNPFVCQWWAVRPTDAEDSHLPGYYLYREIYLTKRTVKWHAVDIKRYSQGEYYLDTFADHDAEDRATLEEAGIVTTRAVKDIGVGIQTTYQLLAGNQVFIFANALVEADQTLYGAHKPTKTIEEFGNYRWAQGTNNQNAKEVPQNRDNHGMDAMRYFFHTLLGGVPEQHVLWAAREMELAKEPARRWGSLLTVGRNWRKG